MKSHYTLLGIEPTADVETIKKAFRQEIALYHPDKVAHLGREFQAMASTRASELTVAYSTLTDLEKRADYDAALSPDASTATAASVPPPPVVQPPTPENATPPPPSRPPKADPAAAEGSFGKDRAGRDDIVRRASLGRIRAVLRDAMSDYDTTPVKGFDLALVSRVKSSIFRKSPPPSLLIKLAPQVDAALVAEAAAQAVKAGLEQKPIVLLLLGDRLAPTGELGQAVEEFRRRNRGLVDTMFPVPVDVRDWSAKIPSNAPPEVRALIEKLKSFSGG